MGGEAVIRSLGRIPRACHACHLSAVPLCYDSLAQEKQSPPRCAERKAAVSIHDIGVSWQNKTYNLWNALLHEVVPAQSVQTLLVVRLDMMDHRAISRSQSSRNSQTGQLAAVSRVKPAT